MIQKRGAAHFEMIASFILFISFVFFLFIYLKPYDTSSLPSETVDQLYDSFKEQSQIDYVKTFLKVTHSGESCFRVSFPPELVSLDEGKSLVVIQGGNMASSGLSGLNLDVEDSKTLSSDAFYEVFISSEFNGSFSGICNEPLDYSFGGIVERKITSLKSLEYLSDQYVNNYSLLRENLGVPEAFDFSVTSPDFPLLEMNKPAPAGQEAIAKIFILEVLNSEGEIINSQFIFQIW